MTFILCAIMIWERLAPKPHLQGDFPSCKACKVAKYDLCPLTCRQIHQWSNSSFIYVSVAIPTSDVQLIEVAITHWCREWCIYFPIKEKHLIGWEKFRRITTNLLIYALTSRKQQGYPAVEYERQSLESVSNWFLNYFISLHVGSVSVICTDSVELVNRHMIFFGEY